MKSLFHRSTTKAYLYPQNFKDFLAPPHPTFQSSQSRNRVKFFLQNERQRDPVGRRLNLGAGHRRIGEDIFNLDMLKQKGIDIQADILDLPIKTGSIGSAVCTGVLEHVADAGKAVAEIHRILVPGGRVFIETPFMQTVHAAPGDYCRWTPEGLRRLFANFSICSLDVVAGPASASAWLFQETMAMLISCRSEAVYKVGLRVFGWLAIPISWLDLLLENHPLAWKAASGFALVLEKMPAPKDPVA